MLVSHGKAYIGTNTEVIVLIFFSAFVALGWPTVKLGPAHWDREKLIAAGACVSRQSLYWDPEFYGDLVYKCKKLIGKNHFSHQFRKNITTKV